MPEAKKQIKQYADETDLIDGLFCYSPVQVYEMIAAYGEKGRNLYIVVELTADLFFYIVIATFLSSLLIWSSIKSKNKSISMRQLLLLPFLSFTANCLENGGIIWMLYNYPEKYFYLALGTSLMTFLKWILLTLCICIVAWNFFRLSFSTKLFYKISGPKKSIEETRF